MAATRRANKATAGHLSVSVPPAHTICGRNLSFAVGTTSEICDDQRDQIWRLFEENMLELYHASSFGWDPLKKGKEMFHPLSRFVVVRDLSSDSVVSAPVIAYSIFRFEREDRQDVVYCYELQVSKEFRRFGLGRLLVQMLSDIGAQWDMTKVMLTVFKANHTAMLFYRSIGFTIDETSPDFSESGAAEDYSILSRCIKP